jgi:hypothetical protein
MKWCKLVLGIKAKTHTANGLEEGLGVLSLATQHPRRAKVINALHLQKIHINYSKVQILTAVTIFNKPIIQ